MFLETEIIGISIDGNIVNSIRENEEGIVILKETPFYAESGGQVGDTGYFIKEGFKGKVMDTKHTKDETIIHLVKVEEGKVNTGDLGIGFC